MRPRGVIRTTIDTVGRRLTAERGGFTWRDVARESQIGWAVARQCVRDMASSGELLPVGEVREPHARRAMTLFASRDA